MKVYHTLTSLIGKHNHEAFRRAANKLGMLNDSYVPKGAWKEHAELFTRNTKNGPVQSYKYTKEFVNKVLELSPNLEKLVEEKRPQALGHRSLSKFIGSSGHARFKDALVNHGYLTPELTPTDVAKGHIKQHGYYYVYSPQIIVKTIMLEPSLLSLYPELHAQYNTIRAELKLPPIELPELITSDPSDSKLSDLDLQ